MWKTLKLGQNMSYLEIFLRLGFWKTKRLLSAPSNLSKQIFMQKQKDIKFALDKNAFGLFADLNF